jgi:hypothetical protein
MSNSISKNRISGWLLKLRGNDRALDRAKFLIDKGTREDALKFLDHSTAVFQQCSQLKSQAARFLFQQEEFAMAVEWLDRGGIAEFDEATVFQWCERIEQSGDIPLAYKLLEIFAAEGISSVEHDSSEIHFRMARLSRIRGDSELAAEQVLRCLESGNYPNVLSMLCSMTSETEKNTLLSGVDRLKEAAKIPGHYAVRINFAIADILKLNGDYQNAAIHLGMARDELEEYGFTLRGSTQLKPSFLIIGTMKSGTTGFYHTLCQHPNIHRAIRKEVRYFSNREATEDWYLAHFPKLPMGQKGITGEATPNYYAMRIQQRVRDTLPGVKLICLLRDPAERAISQYFHGLRHGSIKRPIEQFYGAKEFESFDGKTDGELEKIVFDVGEGDRRFNTTLTYGLYVHFLRKWYREFDASQILLLTLNEFKLRQQTTINKTCDFLGVDRPDALPLTKPLVGKYDPDDESLRKVLPRLRQFYEVPNRKLFEEFGIQFNP